MGSKVVDQWHDLGGACALERDLSSAFQDRVVVSRDGACVFVYAGDRVQAECARDQSIETVLTAAMGSLGRFRGPAKPLRIL